MTYVLGSKSRSELQGVHPKLVGVVERAIEITLVDFTVFDGLRTVAEQREYVRLGVSKTMNSKHIPQNDGFGHAVDLVPWINGKARWEWEPIYSIAAAVWQASEELNVPLVWGGVWDKRMDAYGGGASVMKAEVYNYTRRHPGPDFIDGPHYQMA